MAAFGDRRTKQKQSTAFIPSRQPLGGASMTNIENTWKRKKSLITVKNTSCDFPKCLSSNVSTVTNQVEISKIFNNCFAKNKEK